MKILMTLVLTLVGVVAVLLASPVVASAESGSDRAAPTATMDLGASPAAQPGTPQECLDYEARETASLEVREFAGGDVVVGVSLLAVVVIVLLVILLSD